MRRNVLMIGHVLIQSNPKLVEESCAKGFATNTGDYNNDVKLVMDMKKILHHFCFTIVAILNINLRHRCDVPYSECKATDHKAECVCKEGFKGNGTVECIPEGFTQEENGILCINGSFHKVLELFLD